MGCGASTRPAFSDLQSALDQLGRRVKARDHSSASASGGQRLAGEVRTDDIPTLAKLILPGFDLGAMPNHINRSSLIAPIARGRRHFHHQTVMVTRRDCVMEYSGEQLDEADGDLIMALIAFAQPYPLGTEVPLNRKRLLRRVKTGRIGSSQYEWLHRSLKRLREATLFLEERSADGSRRYAVGRMESFSIVQSLRYDKEGETYTYTLDPRWVVLFSRSEYALIDWDKRMQIGRGQEMAKTLQRLVATSNNNPQRYSLEWLQDKMQYTSPERKFRAALASAWLELQRVEVIVKAEIRTHKKRSPQLVLWLPRSRPRPEPRAGETGGPRGCR